jgi:hypothetical protein
MLEALPRGAAPAYPLRQFCCLQNGREWATELGPADELKHGLRPVPPGNSGGCGIPLEMKIIR